MPLKMSAQHSVFYYLTLNLNVYLLVGVQQLYSGGGCVLKMYIYLYLNVVVGLFRQICGGMIDTKSKQKNDRSKKCYVRGN